MNKGKLKERMHTPMRNIFLRGTLLFMILAGGAALSGCGGSQSSSDAAAPVVEEEAVRVIEITITPPPVVITPTPVFEEKYPQAVVSKDGITFINQYLVNVADGENLR